MKQKNENIILLKKYNESKLKNALENDYTFKLCYEKYNKDALNYFYMSKREELHMSFLTFDYMKNTNIFRNYVYKKTVKIVSSIEDRLIIKDVEVFVMNFSDNLVYHITESKFEELFL